MEAGYGTWDSPITSQVCTESGYDLWVLQVDGDPNYSDTVYWNEIHFTEEGRYVICSANKSGVVTQWTPPGFNARTTVYEYGGADFFVYQGVVYFSNFSDQALYRQTGPDATPEPLTATDKSRRYAYGSFDPKSGRIFCLREDHEVVKSGAKEAKHEIVCIDPNTKEETVLITGSDFYSNPRVSPDGKKIIWVEWMHPNMPWDSTQIMEAKLSPNGDQIIEATKTQVAGGQDESGQDWSVIWPSWTPQGEKLYIGDQTNWWNLYQVSDAGGHVNLHPVEAEIGTPQWFMGMPRYSQDPNGGRIVTSFAGEFGIIDTKTKSYKKIETGFTNHYGYCWTGAGGIYCIAYSGTKFPQVIRVDAATEKVDVIRVSMEVPIDSGYFSVPERISYPTGNGETSHALYYKPTNKDYKALAGELPPLLVRAHGGPTYAYSDSLDLKLQYYTSRGFAVLCVNYRGSTGYGKIYRHRLRKMWGILDTEDCCKGVEYLVSKELADPKRVCIDGESAGGFATLSCLTFTDVFQVGVSHFGISDLEVLMHEIHKFETRYLGGLLAPLDEGGVEICKERSAIHHLEKITTALGFFQGDEDMIVPPNQAAMMYKALKKKGLPTFFVLFQGEKHGFNKAESIRMSLDGELQFFGKVLGFQPANLDAKLHIDNI